MIASFAVFSLLTTAAYAQSSSSTAGSIIPDSASQECKTFMTKLNSDKTLDKCATAFISASSAFSPSNYTDSATEATITSTLDSLCAATCDESAVKASITEFYTACSDELTTGSDQDTLLQYDVVYSLIPFKNALCTKNDNDKYCVLQQDSSTTTTKRDLARRADTVVTTPNATTFTSNNLLYLFLNSSGTASSLCTTCSSNIMTEWLDWEGSIPYGPGLAQSPLMSSQTELYNGIKDVCGEAFLGEAVSAAGGISSSSSSDETSGAMRTSSTLGAVAAVFVLAVSLV